MDIGQFFSLVNAHPWAYPVIFLNLAVIFINGWTDGPNAHRQLRPPTRCACKPKKAVLIAAIGETFLGIIAWMGPYWGSYLA